MVLTATFSSGRVENLGGESPLGGEPIQELVFHQAPTLKIVQRIAPLCLDLERWRVDGGEWQPKANLWRYLKEACRG